MGKKPKTGPGPKRSVPGSGHPGPRQEREGRSVEELLYATLKRHRQLLRPERAFLLELVQGVKRWELQLDYLISQASAMPLKKLHPMVLLILRLAAYQILRLDRVPARATVFEAVLAAKARRLPAAYGGFINAVLRRLAAEDFPPLPDRETDAVLALSLEHSHPPWLVRRWLERWGLEPTAARLAANNRIPPLTIRVNTLKTDVETLRLRLAREGVAAAPCRFSPVGLRLSELTASPVELASYQEGLWLFQDEAAQLITLLLPLEKGGCWLELGAGRGGKTTHLAEKLAGAGLLLALDLHQGHLHELQLNLRRWGAAPSQAPQADGALALPVKEGGRGGGGAGRTLLRPGDSPAPSGNQNPPSGSRPGHLPAPAAGPAGCPRRRRCGPAAASSISPAPPNPPRMKS